MHFDKVLGQEHIKENLIKSVDNGRIPHAQLFVGSEGSGTLAMAIAYATYILCKTSQDKESCLSKCEKFQHPDLHFSFPVATTNSVKSSPVSDLFLKEWRTFLSDNLYGSLFNWMQELQIEKKQGVINIHEAAQINKKLSLKSYEGGFKVMIIWCAEAMNDATSNKLLKLIEEPPEDTLLLLITEDEEQIIKTIVSRCQAVYFNRLSEEVIKSSLIQDGVDEVRAKEIAYKSEGNYNKAIHLTHNDTSELVFEKWFVIWVRSAFKAKGNPSVINDLIDWSNTIAGEGRVVQKHFLQYCLEFFRQALLFNYGSPDLVFLEPNDASFKLEKFAPFVHSENILSIEKELGEAQYHIERNGNAKVILLDLSIKLTRLLHTKENVIQ